MHGKVIVIRHCLRRRKFTQHGGKKRAARMRGSFAKFRKPLTFPPWDAAG
jgi:hypothetical protein